MKTIAGWNANVVVAPGAASPSTRGLAALAAGFAAARLAPLVRSRLDIPESNKD